MFSSCCFNQLIPPLRLLCHLQAIAKDNSCIARPFLDNSCEALVKYLVKLEAEPFPSAEKIELARRVIAALRKVTVTHNMAHINVHQPRCSVLEHPRFKPGSGSCLYNCFYLFLFLFLCTSTCLPCDVRWLDPLAPLPPSHLHAVPAAGHVDGEAAERYFGKLRGLMCVT